MATNCPARVAICMLVLAVRSVYCAVLTEETQTTDLSWIVAVVGMASLLALVVIVSLCGGCTPMEVGSDEHAASGGRKSNVQYSGVCTDANMRVMTSGTSLPNDPYQPGEQALPYSLHPQTDHTFTGYQSQTGYQGQPGYQGQVQRQQSYQSSGAGAHRHFSEQEQEPPPPAYHEAVQSDAPQQSGQGQYGW